MSKQPLLVVEHEAQCPPGWMGEWLSEAGARLDVRRPYSGDALPEDLSEHGGVMVLGGEMGAHDDDAHAWLRDVKRLVVGAVADRTPLLGICLGLQIVAVALGGEVGPNPLGQQIGVLDVGWTDAAYDDRLLGEVAARETAPAVQWNNDVITRLPDAAVALAQTPRGEIQAVRFARTSVWGVQWHPEAGEEIIRPWAAHDRDDAVERGVDVDAYVAEVVAARDDLRATWRLLAHRFARLCREAGPVAQR